MAGRVEMMTGPDGRLVGGWSSQCSSQRTSAPCQFPLNGSIKRHPVADVDDDDFVSRDCGNQLPLPSNVQHSLSRRRAAHWF